MEGIPRLSEKERVILDLLSQQPEMYGLAMVQASDGALKRGTIYVTLGRMVEKGYVESVESRDSGGRSGPPRRTYRLTALGQRVLHAWETMRHLLVWSAAR